MTEVTGELVINDQEEMNPLVMRLLTTEEIDYVSGGHTTHSMGIGSSYSQGAQTHFAQGAFSSYTQGFKSGADEPPPPVEP